MASRMRSRSARAAELKASTPAEARRPLLEKSRDAFPIVLAEPRLALQVALEVELRVEVVRAGPIEGALCEAERARWALRETQRERPRLRHQCLIGNRPPDQAPLGCTLCRPRLA